MVTELVDAWRRGDDGALDRLVPLVYRQLHELATAYLARERRGHTLQPTALVHEAYLRLMDRKPAPGTDRARFLALVAQVMRRVLVDHARQRNAAKRGGGAAALPLRETDAVWQPALEDWLALDETLTRLEGFAPRQSRIVELRFLAGLSVAETAQLLGVSEPTVLLDTRLARAWLFRELGEGAAPAVQPAEAPP